jgi:hypothetical protein
MQEVHTETLARRNSCKLRNEVSSAEQYKTTFSSMKLRNWRIQFNTCFVVAIDNISSNVPMIPKLIEKS